MNKRDDRIEKKNKIMELIDKQARLLKITVDVLDAVSKKVEQLEKAVNLQIDALRALGGKVFNEK